MKNQLVSAAAALGFFAAQLAIADHAYLTLNNDGSLTASGPFNLEFPQPPNAETIVPRNSHTMFGPENLKTSRAGFFDDSRVMILEVETTDAQPGTIDYSGMPTVEMAGVRFPTRTGCLEISQEQLDAGDEPLLVLKPAVYGRQIFLVNEDGTAEGIALYAKRVEECSDVDNQFMTEFDSQFGRFVKSVRAASATQ